MEIPLVARTRSFGNYAVLIAVSLNAIFLPVPYALGKKLEKDGPQSLPKIAFGSLNGAPETLDPAQIIDSAQWHAMVNLGVNLITHDFSGRLVGGAASSWKASSDFREFRFELLGDLRDSDGHFLGAEDWAATFRHLLRSGGSTHSFVAQYMSEDGIEIGPSTLVLRLKKPYQTFIQRLTTPEFILLPKGSIDRDNRVDLRTSSGPYALKEFNKTDKSCVLRANRFFRGYSKEQPQEVVLEQAGSSSSEVLDRLVSGRWQFSLMQMVPTDPAAGRMVDLVSAGSVRAVTTEPSAVGFVLLLDSKRVENQAQRLALARVISEQAEADMKSSYSLPARQIYPHSFIGALPKDIETKIHADILKSDLSCLPKKIKGIGSVLGYRTGTPQWISKALSKRGVEVESKEVPYTEYQKNQSQIDHDFVVVMTGVNAKDPAGSLLTLLSPKSGIIPDKDGKMNALLQRAVESEPTTRANLLHQIVSTLLTGGRIVPFIHYGVSVVSSAEVIANPPSRFDDELRLANIRWKTK